MSSARTGERGQVLPLALMAFAVGAIVVSPFLTNVSVNLLASRRAEEAIADYYSLDAGVEWGLWRLTNDPAITASTSYMEVPLQPTPPSVNGAAFPTTEIRFVAGTGDSDTISPAWQSGGGPKCYPFTSSSAGTVTAVITTPASTVRADLRTSCSGGGLPNLSGSSPYTVQFPGQAAGSYTLVVQTVPPDTGSLTITYPSGAPAYDIRSQRNGRTITARATASVGSVTLLSWTLD